VHQPEGGERVFHAIAELEGIINDCMDRDLFFFQEHFEIFSLHIFKIYMRLALVNLDHLGLYYIAVLPQVDPYIGLPDELAYYGLLQQVPVLVSLDSNESLAGIVEGDKDHAHAALQDGLDNIPVIYLGADFPFFPLHNRACKGLDVSQWLLGKGDDLGDCAQGRCCFLTVCSDFLDGGEEGQVDIISFYQCSERRIHVGPGEFRADLGNDFEELFADYVSMFVVARKLGRKVLEVNGAIYGYLYIGQEAAVYIEIFPALPGDKDKERNFLQVCFFEVNCK